MNIACSTPAFLLLHVHLSFDQHALLDLPTMLSTALQVSGKQQLYYIGHSQGTIMSFINFLNHSQAKLVKKMYALAPVVYIKNVRGVLAYIAPIYKLIQVSSVYVCVCVRVCMRACVCV